MIETREEHKMVISEILDVVERMPDSFSEIFLMNAISGIPSSIAVGLAIVTRTYKNPDSVDLIRLVGLDKKGRYLSDFPHCMGLVTGLGEDATKLVFDSKSYSAMVPTSSTYLKSEFISRLSAHLDPTDYGNVELD